MREAQGAVGGRRRGRGAEAAEETVRRRRSLEGVVYLDYIEGLKVREVAVYCGSKGRGQHALLQFDKVQPLEEGMPHDLLGREPRVVLFVAAEVAA